MNQGADNIITHLMPLGYAVIIFVIAFGLAKSVIRGHYKDIPVQLLVYCVVAYMIWAPTQFREIGKIVIDFVKSIGGGLVS